jgi:hypothetical protein
MPDVRRRCRDRRDRQDPSHHLMPAPSFVRQFLLFLLLLLAGMVGGIALADHFAPGSRLAGFIGLLSFSLPLLIGMLFWLGITILVAAWRVARHGFSFSPSQPVPPVQIPPGAGVFVPTSAALLSLAGLFIGLLGSAHGLSLTIGVYFIAGVLHGLICSTLGRRGFLPFPHG